MDDASDDPDDVMEDSEHDGGERVEAPLPDPVLLDPELRRRINIWYQSGQEIMVVAELARRQGNSRPKGPTIDPGMLKAEFTLQKNIRGIPDIIAETLSRIAPDLRVDRRSFEIRRTYRRVRGSEVDASGQRVAGGKELVTYISKQNQHLHFSTLSGETGTFPGKVRELRHWLYWCWLKGSEPDAGDSQIPLKYITFQSYGDEDIYNTLRVLSADTSDSLGFWPGVGAGTVTRYRSDIYSRIGPEIPDGDAALEDRTFTIFHGIPLVKEVLEMVLYYPDIFQGYQASAIGFEIQKGTSTPPDASPENRPHYNIVIKLDREQPPLGFAPGGDGVSVDTETVSGLTKHPYYADFIRASHYLREDPTFTSLKVPFFGIEYSFAISRLERHIVFNTLSVEKAPEGAIVLRPANRNPIEDFADVIYSTWNREAGQMDLLALTFGQIQPKDRDNILSIRKLRMLMNDEDISVFSQSDPDFNSAFNSLKKSREGKVLETLLQLHAEKLSISGVFRFKIGIFTKESSVLRKGRPFILVEFKPIVRNPQGITAINQASPLGLSGNTGDVDIDIDIDMAEANEETTSRNSGIRDSDGVSHASAGNLWASLEFGCRNQAEEDFVRLYPVLPPESLAARLDALGERYQYIVPSDSAAVEADRARKILENLMDIQITPSKGNVGGNVGNEKVKFKGRTLVLYIFSQAIQHLCFEVDSEGNSVLKDPYNEDYKVVQVEEKTPTPSRNTMRLVINGPMGHVAVFSLSEWMTQTDIGDVFLASWNSFFKDTVFTGIRRNPYERISKRTPKSGISKVSFIFVMPDTQEIIEHVYQMNALQKEDTLTLWATLGPRNQAGVDTKLRTHRRLAFAPYRYSAANRLSWLLLLGTSEVLGVGRMARKYRGSRPIATARFITGIVVRWVSAHADNGDDAMRPEMTVILGDILISQDASAEDRPLVPTELKGLLPEGGANFLMNDYQGMLPAMTDDIADIAFGSLDHTGWIISEGDCETALAPRWANDLITSANLPGVILKTHPLRASRMYLRIKQAVYVRCSVHHTSQDFQNSFLLLKGDGDALKNLPAEHASTPIRGHIIIQEAIPELQPSIEPVLSKLWLAESPIPPLLITFRRLSSTTEKIILVLWDDLKDPKWEITSQDAASADTAPLAPKEVKIRVTTGDTDKADHRTNQGYLPSDRDWRLSSQSWKQTFDILMATAEGQLVFQFLQRNFEAMGRGKIVSIYVGSKADGTDLKMLFDIQQRVDTKPDPYGDV
ncbi:hypothetical protein TWF506_010730 [Arthrobotrys conoides]|uniref:Uncharacterized protein n=1 Tax=Arthrobotrys conoides TaxID=74498 RepID=A0AAN8RW38_9PEZI